MYRIRHGERTRTTIVNSYTARLQKRTLKSKRKQWREGGVESSGARQQIRAHTLAGRRRHQYTPAGGLKPPLVGWDVSPRRISFFSGAKWVPASPHKPSVVPRRLGLHDTAYGCSPFSSPSRSPFTLRAGQRRSSAASGGVTDDRLCELPPAHGRPSIFEPPARCAAEAALHV